MTQQETLGDRKHIPVTDLTPASSPVPAVTPGPTPVVNPDPTSICTQDVPKRSSTEGSKTYMLPVGGSRKLYMDTVKAVQMVRRNLRGGGGKESSDQSNHVQSNHAAFIRCKALGEPY